MSRGARTIWLATLPAVMVLGCAVDWSWPAVKRQTEVDEAERDEPTGEDPSIVYKDTIGQIAWFEGMRKMRVRGYGLVVGLGDSGSSECPREVRDKLLDTMYKNPVYRNLRWRHDGQNPERMIDDPDTAVVLVQGEISAGAVKGAHFDVAISAVPGTQTKSLRGGYLLPCDLNIYRMLTPSAGISGQSLARAAGPVFMNPFSDRPGSATRSIGRTSTVLGGGMVDTDRRLRLVLFQPSYSTARRVASRINARFGEQSDVADAQSPSYIRLTVPGTYERDPRHFLQLVQHFYLPQRPGLATTRARQLADLIAGPDAPRADIALAWEALGKSALETVSKLYGHPDREVAFFAALAGLRLGDGVAVETIAEHAEDARSPLRLQAIHACARAEEVIRAENPLRRLLDDPDPIIRAAAYEALLERRSLEIETQWVGQDNFALDLVMSSGKSMIYAKRGKSRRIAIFGPNPRCVPPVFYSHAGGDLTINAHDGDDGLTILRKLPQARTALEPITTGFDVLGLIRLLGDRRPRYPGEPRGGLAVDYGTVVQALYELCKSGSIEARFLMEQGGIKELFGPAPPAGRPESEFES